MFLLEGENPKRYYGLWSEIHNDKIKGHTTLPKTAVKDFYMLKKWKVSLKKNTRKMLMPYF